MMRVIGGRRQAGTRRPAWRARPRIRTSGGFTLLEVLAALMLMAVVLPVVISALGSSTRAGSLTKSRDVALALAESKLAEAVVDGSWRTMPRQGTFDTDADFGSGVERFAWTLHMRDWNDPGLRELVVEVHWDQRGRAWTQRLATVVRAEEGVR